MRMTSTDAMILLGSVHKVEIDGKGTDHVDCGIQVALLYNARDFLVQCGYFVLQLSRFGFTGIYKALSTLTQTPAAYPQPLLGIKHSWLTMLLDSTSQSISQRVDITA